MSILVPAVWETVFERYVLLVDGPMDGNVLVWPAGVQRFVLNGVSTGWYVPSEGGHFGVWTEVKDAGDEQAA